MLPDETFKFCSATDENRCLDTADRDEDDDGGSGRVVTAAAKEAADWSVDMLEVAWNRWETQS